MNIQPFDFVSVIITPAPGSSGGYIVNGVAQAVVLPSTSTTVQVTSPQAGSVIAPSTSVASPTSSPVRSTSAPSTPKAKAPTPSKPKKTGSLALFFRKVTFVIIFMLLVTLHNWICIGNSREIRFPYVISRLQRMKFDCHLSLTFSCFINSFIIYQVFASEIYAPNLMSRRSSVPGKSTYKFSFLVTT